MINKNKYLNCTNQIYNNSYSGAVKSHKMSELAFTGKKYETWHISSP